MNSSPLTLINDAKVALEKVDFSAAELLLKQAMALDDQNFLVHYLLGLVYANQNQFQQAIESFGRAVALQPNSAEANYNLALMYLSARDYQKALPFHQRSIELNPKNSLCYLNRGVTYMGLRKFQLSIESFSQSFSLDPSSVGALTNIGNALRELNLFSIAMDYYKKSLAILPTYADAHFNESLILLAQENYKLGWWKYEFRWQVKNLLLKRHQNIPRPKTLLDLKDKKILVWYEQGHGDSIQFSRYALELQARGFDMIFEVQPGLKTLFLNSGFKSVIAMGEEIGHVDFQCPLMSLPLLFGDELKDIPYENRYLSVPSTLVDQWKNKTKRSKRKLKIGIACSGSSTFKDNSVRSVILNKFSLFLDIADLYIIQKEITPGDRVFIKQHKNVYFLGDDLTDFSDTAAVVENMDVVITVCTSLAHLSGALGKSTIILLPWVCDWRWLLNRNDSPWYASVKLFRQPEPDDWDSVLSDVYQHLKFIDVKG